MKNFNKIYHNHMKKIANEFLVFLKEYKIVSLALAFIMGTATTALVNSLVNNIVMPFLTPFMPADGWRDAVLKLGPIDVKWGAFVAELITFLVLAIVVFFIAKWILKQEEIKKI